MKKFMCVMLALMMLLSVSLLMTACGEPDDAEPATTSGGRTNNGDGTTNNGGDTNDGGEGNNPFPAALGNLEVIPIPDVTYTGWHFVGGLIDGKEMEDAEVSAILDACGGSLEMYFPMPDEAAIANEQEYYAGTYTIVSDGYVMDMDLDAYEYYGLFTQFEGENVLILINKEESNTAFYMMQIQEG